MIKSTIIRSRHHRSCIIFDIKSNCINKCKCFLLFYTKSLFFLFYAINLQILPHQIIRNTPSFIKIILFTFSLIISLTHTRPHHLTKHHFSERSLSLSFSPSSFYLLLSSSPSLLLQFFFFNIFFLSSFSFFFFFFISKKKIIIFLFLPLSFSIKLVLSSNL